MKKPQSAKFLGVYFPCVMNKSTPLGFGFCIFRSQGKKVTIVYKNGKITEFYPIGEMLRKPRFVKAITRLSVQIGGKPIVGFVLPTGKMIAGGESTIFPKAKESLPEMERQGHRVIAYSTAKQLKEKVLAEEIRQRIALEPESGKEIAECLARSEELCNRSI